MTKRPKAPADEPDDGFHFTEIKDLAAWREERKRDPTHGLMVDVGDGLLVPAKDFDEVERDADEQWVDVQRRGWDEDEFDPWTLARCWRLAADRARIKGTPEEGNTLQVFSPGDALAIPEYMVPFYRAMIDDEVADGAMKPERRRECLRALAARVINIDAVIMKREAPRYGAVAK